MNTEQLFDALRLDMLRRDLEDRRGPGRAITIEQIGANLKGQFWGQSY